MVRNALIKVEMNVYWREVLSEVNQKLESSYPDYQYIAGVYSGTKYSKAVDSVLDECIETVNKRFAERGLESRNPITPRNRA